MATLGIPQNTIEILRKYDFCFQKKFGQNFLIDPHVLERIVEEAGIGAEDFVLEIGPGIGTMTQYLCESAREVLAVEIDRKLIPVLGETLADYQNVTVLNEDILKLDLGEIAEKYNAGRPVKVVANLPYYITTPIIMELFESHVPLRDGAGGGCRPDEGKTRNKGVRGFVISDCLLCGGRGGGKCSAQLLYAKTKGVFCGCAFELS